MKRRKTIYTLKDYKSIDDLKNISYEDLKNLSNDLSSYILNIVSKHGGHLSSNLGVIDSTISLLKTFDIEKDKIIFDVGHQTYAYKILTGRDLSTLREKNGISGFQKMSESIYDHYEAGHSSTSISAAIGMAYARDLKKESYQVVAFIGDGSLMNGLALEGLNLGASSNHKIIIVVNDNEMSISKPVGSLANAFRKFSTSTFYLNSKKAYKKLMLKTKLGDFIYRGTLKIKNWFKSRLIKLNLFDYFGYKFIGPIDGHNIKAMEKAFNKAKKIEQSCVVYLKTVKGKGYKFAEEDSSGQWHGVKPFDLDSGAIIKKRNNIFWPQLYETLLLDEMKNNLNVFCIVPATGTGSMLEPIFKQLPERILDVGINEEHAFTMASGLASQKIYPIIFIYSTFLQRGYDEINHDLARMKLNCTILVDRCGLIGKDGETHQGIFDQSILYPLPNVNISMASNEFEAKFLLKESVKGHSVSVIRFPNQPVEDTINTKEYKLSYGKWIKIMGEEDNKKLAVITFGPFLVSLYNYIRQNNLNITLINALYQKPLDTNLIQQITNFERIIIIDPYSTRDGFINNLIRKLVDLSYKGKIIERAVPNKYISQATVEEQKIECGLDLNSIINLIKNNL